MQEAFQKGSIKYGEDGKIEVVTDPEESEMIRLSQYDDAQSQQSVKELNEKIESKKKGRDFEIDGINNANMEDHTTVGKLNIAAQFRHQEKHLQSK